MTQPDDDGASPRRAADELDPIDGIDEVTGPAIGAPGDATTDQTPLPMRLAPLTTPAGTSAAPAVRPNYPTGHRLGRYTLDDVIGIGAFSTVYRATDTALSLPVVVKVLSPMASTAAVERFRNEILFSRRIHHPGFCRIFELHEEETFDGPLRYLTMELVQGRTLGDLMNEGPMSAGRAVNLARGLCDVVSAAHEQGIVHGDLKPGNIMVRTQPARRGMLGDRRLEARDELVVLDFGAASAKDIVDTGVRVGSVRYMAPELFQRERPSPQSDVWAIGVILYGCLTGGYPFDGKTERDVAEATRRPVQPPSAQRPGLGDAVDDVVMGSLAADRSVRFADCRALAAALDDTLDRLRERPSLLRRLLAVIGR
jgi:serine/threonine-protein kinase